MHLLLYAHCACNREPFVREALTTDWSISRIEAHGLKSVGLDAAREAVAQADAMIAQWFEPELTSAAGKLRLILVPGAGIDAFVPDAIPPGCVLCNCFEHEAPIAEYVMLNCLLHATRQDHYARLMHQGKWDGSGRHDGETHGEVMGKTLGLVGYGHIGREVAARARAFGMRVIAVRRTPADDPLLDWCGPVSEIDRLMRNSDYLVLALPQTDESVGLIGADQLRLLKPTAYLINPARAPIIDEHALYTALKERWFEGAALDAQYRYPKRVEDDMLGWNEPFHELENVILTPHFSAWTDAMIRRRCAVMAANLDRLARGEQPFNVVIDKR